MIQPDPNPTDASQIDRDGVIRAFDKSYGDEIWEYRLGKVPHGTPMTYMYEGKQYVGVAIVGRIQPSELIAFRLNS